MRDTSKPTIHECTCSACGKSMLTTPGTPCFCGGVLNAGQEMTRKAFGREDTDLKKA